MENIYAQKTIIMLKKTQTADLCEIYKNTKANLWFPPFEVEKKQTADDFIIVSYYLLHNTVPELFYKLLPRLLFLCCRSEHIEIHSNVFAMLPPLTCSASLRATLSQLSTVLSESLFQLDENVKCSLCL